MSATRTMDREDTAIILNDDSVVSSFGFEKNLSTITAWVLILLLSYDKSTIRTQTARCRIALVNISLFNRGSNSHELGL